MDREGRIARFLVSAFLGAGYTLGVNDGEETVLTHCSNPEKILGEMRATDMDWLIVYGDDRKRVGSVMLVWGNGSDLISDYTDVPAIAVLADAAIDYAESLAVCG